MLLQKSLTIIGVIGALLATEPVSAITIWQNPGPGDWFDASNWNNGTPNAAEDAFVNNGGVAIASFGGPATANNLSIGIRNSGFSLSPDATGAVEMNDVNLQVGGGVIIGQVSIAVPAGLGDSATGSLTTTAGGNANGDVDLNGDLAVGRLVSGPPTSAASGSAMIAGDVSGATSVEVGTAEQFSVGDATGVMAMSGNLVGGGPGGAGISVGRSSGGTADGSLIIGGDASNIFQVRVGDLGSFATGDASGEFMLGGNLSGTFSGGVAVGFAAEGGAATGTAVVGGGIDDYVGVLVGRVLFNGDAGTQAVGSLTVLSGGVTNNLNGDSVDVGAMDSNGLAHGIADITGGIDGYDEINVGVVRGNSSQGDAIGQLSVNGGPVNAGSMMVGVSEGIGSASGIASFDEVLVTLSDALTLGTGSTLGLTMNGAGRGVDYAAIDANQAFLDGVLEVFFTFQPVMMTFDLIISESSNGILGDFASVDIMGLLPGTLFTSGIVTDNFGMGDVEVYRLSIDDVAAVPEPGTLWLLGLGVLGIVLILRVSPRTAGRDYRPPQAASEVSSCLACS